MLRTRSVARVVPANVSVITRCKYFLIWNWITCRHSDIWECYLSLPTLSHQNIPQHRKANRLLFLCTVWVRDLQTRTIQVNKLVVQASLPCVLLLIGSQRFFFILTLSKLPPRFTAWTNLHTFTSARRPYASSPSSPLSYDPFLAWRREQYWHKLLPRVHLPCPPQELRLSKLFGLTSPSLPLLLPQRFQTDSKTWDFPERR